MRTIDSKGSIPRGHLCLNVDIKAGCSTRIPGETALQHAKRLQVGVRNCIECGSLTGGSIGAAGIRWAMLCQPCKDKADALALARISYGGKLGRMIMGALVKRIEDEDSFPATDRASFTYTGALVAQDFAGMSPIPPQPISEDRPEEKELYEEIYSDARDAKVSRELANEARDLREEFDRESISDL